MKERWVTSQSSDKLSALLGITRLDTEQDWKFVHADALRVEEFMEMYGHSDFNEDDRFALMALIVASFDEWLGANHLSEEVMQRIQQLVIADHALHEFTVHYWCVWDEPDPENFFRATPFMRTIWKKQNP